MLDTFGFQVFLNREMGNSNGRCQLFFVISLSRMISTETDIDEAYTNLTNIVAIPHPTFRIESCRTIDLDGDAVDNLSHR